MTPKAAGSLMKGLALGAALALALAPAAGAQTSSPDLASAQAGLSARAAQSLAAQKAAAEEEDQSSPPAGARPRSFRRSSPRA